MPNNPVYEIKTSLRPGSSVESVITVTVSGTPAVLKIGEGEVKTRSSHEAVCQILIEYGAWAGPNGYPLVSRTTPEVLGQTLRNCV